MPRLNEFGPLPWTAEAMEKAATAELAKMGKAKKPKPVKKTLDVPQVNTGIVDLLTKLQYSSGMSSHNAPGTYASIIVDLKNNSIVLGYDKLASNGGAFDVCHFKGKLKTTEVGIELLQYINNKITKTQGFFDAPKSGILVCQAGSNGLNDYNRVEVTTGLFRNKKTKMSPFDIVPQDFRSQQALIIPFTYEGATIIEKVVDFLRPGIGKGAINADVETVSDYPIETVRQWHYYNAKNIEKQFNQPDDYFKTNVGYSVVEFLDVILARCYDDEGTLRSLSMFDESNPHDLFAQKRTADFMQTLDFDVVEREFKAFLSSEGVNPVAKNAKGESTYSYGTLREEFKEYIKYLMG